MERKKNEETKSEHNLLIMYDNCVIIYVPGRGKCFRGVPNGYLRDRNNYNSQAVIEYAVLNSSLCPFIMEYYTIIEEKPL